MDIAISIILLGSAFVLLVAVGLGKDGRRLEHIFSLQLDVVLDFSSSSCESLHLSAFSSALGGSPSELGYGEGEAGEVEWLMCCCCCGCAPRL